MRPTPKKAVLWFGLGLGLAACGASDRAERANTSDAAANAAVVRTVYDGFAAGDMSLATSRFADDISWREADSIAYADGNPYRGADAVIGGVFARIGGEWTGFSAEPETFVSEDEHVVVLGRYGGTYGTTGAALDAPFGHVWTVEDGEITSFRQLTDTAAWNRAMGRADD